MIIRVVLNGDRNLFGKYNLKQNPFPKYPNLDAKTNTLLNRLAAGPIVDTPDLVRLLIGCSEEFQNLCCDQFRPGQRVSFNVKF